MGKPIYLVELSVLAWPQMLRSGLANANGSWYIGRTRVAVNPALTYRQTAVLRRSATANGTFYVGVTFYDSAGAQIVTPAPYTWVAASALVPGTGFATATAQFGSGTGISIPAGAVTMAPVLVGNYTSTLGTMDCLEQWVELSSAPGVALTADRYFRDQMEWAFSAGTEGSFLTQVDGAAQSLVLRYATGAYMTQPSDTPPSAQYDARVRQPGQLRMALPDGLFGGITSSFGQIVLENSDGALDGLAYFGLDGQPFAVLAGQDDAAYGSFTAVMRGTMQQPMVDRKAVTIRLAGRDAAFDEPVLSGRYLGNNSLPSGLEGGPEMAGQPKPRVYGVVWGIEPPCVNTARYIYQVDGGPYATTITSAWDAGVLMTQGALYSSQADMETTAPAAGTYRVWQAGGCMRLGSAPSGVITCDAESLNVGSGAPEYFYWKLLYRLAIDAGVQASEIQFGQNAALSQPDNWPGADYEAELPLMGVWVTDAQTRFREVMDQVASAVGAWYGFINWGGSTSTAALKLGSEVFAPNLLGNTGSVPLFDDSNLTALTAIADPGPGRGVPVWSVELGYRQNQTVFTPSMAPTVLPEVITTGLLGLKNKRALVEDSAVKSKNPNARKVVRETCLQDFPARVGYEAGRQLELLRYTKQWFEARAKLEAVRDMSTRPRLGAYARVDSSRLAVLHQDGVTRPWGYFNVMAMEIDWARGDLRMTLRQATEPSL